jgi:hypothetical protein
MFPRSKVAFEIKKKIKQSLSRKKRFYKSTQNDRRLLFSILILVTKIALCFLLLLLQHTKMLS